MIFDTTAEHTKKTIKRDLLHIRSAHAWEVQYNGDEFLRVTPIREDVFKPAPGARVIFNLDALQKYLYAELEVCT